MRTPVYRPARSALWATVVCGVTLFLLSSLSGHAATKTELASFYDEFLNEDYRGGRAKDMPKHAQAALEKYLKERRVMKLAGGGAAGVGTLGLFLGLLASIFHARGVKQSLAGPSESSHSNWVKTQEATVGERALDALSPADKNWYNPLWKGAAGLGALLMLSSFGLIFAALQARTRNKANRMVYRQLLQRVGSRGGAADFDETQDDFDSDSVGGEARGPKMVAEQSRTPVFYPRPQMGAQVVSEQKRTSGSYPRPNMGTEEVAGQSRTSGFYPRVQMGTRAPAGALQESLAGIVERPMDHEWPTHGWRLATGPQWASQAESDSSSVSNDE